MKATTHLAFAGLTGVIATGFNADITLAAATALALGSILPDIDSPQSFIGSLIKKQSKWLERNYGHRTLTHSLLGLSILAISSSFLIFLGLNIWIWLLVGYATHLLLDTANIMGIPLLWPHKLQFWLVHNRAWRVPYGSNKENIWLISFTLSALMLTPLAIDGFSPWFHRFLGTTYGAVEDYLQWHENFEVYVNIKGVNLLTGEKITARYKAIDTLSKERLLVEDKNGNAYEVSHGINAQIWPKRITAWREETINTNITKLELNQQTISSLIETLPTASNTYITAKLELDEHLTLAPTIGKFERIKVNGNSYTLRAATVTDLYKLKDLYIEQGSVIIRTETHTTHPPATAKTTPQPTGKIYTLDLKLTTLEYLLIKEGDSVQAKQAIAKLPKNPNSIQLENALTLSQNKLKSLQADITFEQNNHNQTLKQRNTQLQQEQQKLETLAYLVTQHAASKLELKKAKHALEELKNQISQEQTNWQQKKRQLQNEIQAAQMNKQELELQLTTNLKELELSTPISGEIMSIKTKSITTDGISILIKIRTEK